MISPYFTAANPFLLPKFGSGGCFYKKHPQTRGGPPTGAGVELKLEFGIFSWNVVDPD